MSATAVAPTSAPRTAWRGWVAAGLVLVLVFVLFGLIADALGPGPQGPAESSFATSSSGFAAWAELLDRAGHPVSQVRRPLTDASLPPGLTLVVIGATALSPGAAHRLRAFLGAGGRLILGGGSLDQVMAPVISSPPSWSPGGPRAYRPSGFPGVSSLVTAGQGSFGSGAALVVGRAVGAGEAELLADPSPVENRLLAQADNAQLAIDLAGAPGRPVVFDEALHGFGPATGLAAIPPSWWLAFAGLALAGVAWAVSRGKRLGTPEAPPPAAAPPRSDYVDALAATLLRARDPERVARLASEAAARGRRH